MFDVTTPATDRSLLTVAEARVAIGSESTNVVGLIARVSATIVRYCKVAAAGAVPPTLRLEAVADTFRLKSHQDALLLSRRPVTEIASIVENDVTLVEDEDFEVDASAGIVKRLSDDAETCWPCGKIVVAYSAGWSTVPDDLKEAAMKLCASIWSEDGKGDPNLKRVEVPGVITREYWVGPKDDPLITQEIADLLVPYRNQAFG